MGPSYKFILALIPGTPPLIGTVTSAQWNLWLDDKLTKITILQPRSMQAQVNRQRQMEIVIGPVYPMLTKQAELVCAPTAIECLGDVDGDTCTENAALYRDYLSAAEAWYKEAAAARAGITLAGAGDIPLINQK